LHRKGAVGFIAWLDRFSRQNVAKEGTYKRKTALPLAKRWPRL